MKRKGGESPSVVDVLCDVCGGEGAYTVVVEIGDAGVITERQTCGRCRGAGKLRLVVVLRCPECGAPLALVREDDRSAFQELYDMDGETATVTSTLVCDCGERWEVDFESTLMGLVYTVKRPLR